MLFYLISFPTLVFIPFYCSNKDKSWPRETSANERSASPGGKGWRSHLERRYKGWGHQSHLRFVLRPNALSELHSLNYTFPCDGNQQRALSRWASTLAAHLESPERGKEAPRLGPRSQGFIQLAWVCTSAL